MRNPRLSGMRMEILRYPLNYNNIYNEKTSTSRFVAFSRLHSIRSTR